MRYPVRCCCDGSKLYGFLDIPTDRKFADGERFAVQIYPQASARLDDAYSTRKVRNETVTLRRFRDFGNGVDEIAVYSDDRPIEFWRTVSGFTELKPVMHFSTRTLAREMRAESEAMSRRALLNANRRPLSMAEANALCQQADASVNRTWAADAAAMRDQIQRLVHPSVYLAMITVGRELMQHLIRFRNENSAYREPAGGDPQTFLGIEIEEDVSLPEGAFEVFTNGETAILKLAEIRRDAGLAEAIARGVRF